MNTTIDIENEFLLIQKSLKSYLYRLTANILDAEDLLHDTFIKVNERIDSFQGKSTFKTWVFAIATNLAKDKKRVLRRWDIEAQDKCKEYTMTNENCRKRLMSSYQNQKIKSFDISEHINYCFTCIAKNLTLEKQIAIILKEFYHFKRQEIAQIIDKTEGVVKHLLHDARKELQSKYEQRCAMINKNGACYQCAELNDTLQEISDSSEKIQRFGFSFDNTSKINLEIRFKLINQINPLESNGAKLEDTILQLLREAIEDK